MYKGEKKKVLFVIGMDHKIEPLIRQVPNINPENMMVLQSFGSVITPFSDFMKGHHRGCLPGKC